MGDVQTLFVGRIQLYQFIEESGQYNEFGACGCCIMGSPTTLLYKLGCYADSGTYHCTGTIAANNETGVRLALQENGYVSFKDDEGRAWSLLFPDNAKAVEFAANVSVAMYGAAGSPEANIIACDVAVGKKERGIFANDKVKVRYQSWVMLRGAGGREVSRLGSSLESNEGDEKPYMFTVPPNHVSVSADMKGFEGMLVGSCEDTQRIVVIPQSAKRGNGPNTHMCYYVHILKKKEGGGGPNNNSNQQQQQPQQQQQIPVYQQQLQLAAHPSNVQGGGYANSVMISEAVAPPQVHPPAPPPPPPGFNGDQLMIVDRMRDQIQALSQQLREATQKIDLLNNDFKVQQQKTKPQSLGSAQLEFSIQKMIQDTEDLKDEMQKREAALKQVEEKNRDLQRKVERFTATANQLAEEKKGAINLGSEEKIDMDRRIAQLQSQLTRIQGEREDVARHLSTTKRLLEISDQDLKAEKGKFQVAQVTFQTNDSKLAACEESMIEERSRRKVLESKCATLGDELRTLSESLRVKDGQMEERRRKMDADKLHYTQLMDDERIQAAAELRELRQELVDELAIRERRYQEERQRVSTESFERGRVQGVEDGHSEALLEADQKVQELVLSVQRSKSEVETMKIRLRQAKEQADADQRRLNAQISALQRAVDDLDAQNNTTELEMDSLKQAKSTVEGETFDRIAAGLRGLSRTVGKKDLLTLLHALRVHKQIDYSFETGCEEALEERLAAERQEVQRWVRESLIGGGAGSPPVAFPAMRTRVPEEKILPYSGDVAASVPAGPVAELPPGVLEMVVQSEEQRQQDVLRFDPEAMNRRYHELLSQMDDDNPELGLIEKKPPKPPTPPRTPTPPRPATPPREPTPVQTVVAPQPAAAANSSDSEDVPEAAKPADPPALPASASSSDADEAPTAKPAVQGQPQQSLPALDDSDEEDAPVATAPPPAQASPSSSATGGARMFASSSSSESDVPPKRPSPKAASPVAKQSSASKAKNAFGSDSESDTASAPSPPAATKKKAPVAAPEEEDMPAPPKAKAKPSPVVKKSSMFADSTDDDAAPPSKPVAPPKRAAPMKKSTFVDSDDDSDVAPPPKGKSIATKASAAPAKKKSMFADSDSDVAPPPKKASGKTVAAKAAGKRALPVKKKSMFDDSD